MAKKEMSKLAVELLTRFEFAVRLNALDIEREVTNTRHDKKLKEEKTALINYITKLENESIH